MRYFFPFILVAATFSSVIAQDDPEVKRRGSRIIDDTTKQIYGPNTSRYFYENDVFYNRAIIHPIDTLIRNFHRFNYVQRYNNLYQDLGNIGTAIRPIFYEPPSVIGVRSGFDAYDLYWDTEEIRYYDTRSPYSNMNVILGGKGRSLTKATFSRNVNPRWNFGLTYRGFFIDKQVPERRGKGDRVTRSNYYHFFTSYHSKDSLYRLFANFKRIFHRVEEFGGAKVAGPDSSFRDYFDPNVRVWLNEAESNDLRANIHINQQFRIGSGLQVYHTFDRYRQKIKFLDLYSADRDFFGFVNIDNDSTHDVAKFKVVRNEAGIKGNLLKLFYNGYYAIRHYSMTYNHMLQNEMNVAATGDEHYLGGRMELNIDSVGMITGWAEVNQRQDQSQNYRIEGRIDSRWFGGSIRQMTYVPSFQQQVYRGAHHQWDTVYKDIESSQINGYLQYRSKVFNIMPAITFTRLKNYVFFDQVTQVDTVQQVFPVQSAGQQIFFSPELRLSITLFRNFTFTNQAVYTTFAENADDAMRIPELFINSQISYSNIHFNGNLDMHAGVDLHWKSSYFAPGYDPALRQFYNQDEFKVEAYPIVDIFLNAKIKRGRVFVKWNNILQAFRKDKTGYFTTPFYPGQRNIIDFGFDWSFYD